MTMTIFHDDLLPLKFANREEELRVIFASGKPLLLIDAPSGYGKTYILEEVKRRLKDEWKCVIVDLEQCQGKRTIRNEITDQIKAPKISTSDDRNADSFLMGVLGNAGKVILMFDSIEMAADGDREWLLDDFMPDCVRNIPGTGFRVIVAGRYAGVTFPAMLRGYESISLTPFSQTVVKEVLRDTLKMYPLPSALEIGEERLKIWSRYIVRLSGGHPRSIQRLVTDLAKEKHWIINFPRQEVQLFNEHIAPEIDLLIAGLDEPMKQALEIVSIFRVFTYNVVDALQKAALPSDVEFPQENSRSVVNKLISCGLFIREGRNNPFYSDKTIRNLILARRRILSPAIYQELNRLAQNIYDAWIEKLIQAQGELGPASPRDLLMTFVNESIYHFCQGFLNDTKLTQQQMADCLRKHSNNLVQGLGKDKQDPFYRMMLENMVIGDYEIREILEAHRLDFSTLWEIAFETNASVLAVPKTNGDSTPIDRKLRVFLCHASQDKPVVREIHQRLAAKNWIEPWLDVEELLPGQEWEREIRKAVKVSDVVIVCLSNSSVTKEGYVQRELRLALDISDQKPDGTIFVLPLRLDSCQVPNRLKKWHYVDYFPGKHRDQTLQKIFLSLEELRKHLQQK